MARIYLDQMALIALGRRRLNQNEMEVRRRIETGQATLVLSPTHWVDTAGGGSEQRSKELARFIDSLHPVWLRERVNTHRLEIRYFLGGIPFERLWQDVVCQTVTAVVADIGGLVAGGAVIVDTEIVVAHLRESRRAREFFQRAYSQNERAFRENRQRYKRGLFTPGLEGRLHAQYLRRMGGIGEGTAEDQRIQAAPPEALRSIVCEWEATRAAWQQGGVMTRNRLRDLFHVTVAMPYTNVILTCDIQMRQTIRTVTEQVNFPVGGVVGSMGEVVAELDRSMSQA